MKAFTVKNTWSNTPDHGWGNGYVAIPPTSSWHGVKSQDIPVYAYKGLTYSGLAKYLKDRGVDVPDFINNDDWVVGFDTCHLDDGNMNKSKVERETYKLLGALEQLSATPFQKDIIKMVRCPVCSSLNNLQDDESDYYNKSAVLRQCSDCKNHFYFYG